MQTPSWTWKESLVFVVGMGVVQFGALGASQLSWPEVPASGADRDVFAAAGLADGTVLLAEIVDPLLPRYRWWVFDPWEGDVVAVPVADDLYDLMPTFVGTGSALAVSPRASGQLAEVRLPGGGLRWLGPERAQERASLQESMHQPYNPLLARETDVPIGSSAMVLLQRPDAQAVQVLRDDRGQAITVDGDPVYVVAFERARRRTSRRSRWPFDALLDRWSGAGRWAEVVRWDEAAGVPRWVLDDERATNSHQVYDAAVRRGPYEVVLVVGGAARTIDLRVGAVLRDRSF